MAPFTGSINIRRAHERATPHKIALCVLIKLYVSPNTNPGRDEDPSSARNVSACPLDNIQVRGLQIYLVRALKNVDKVVEPVLSETCAELEKSVLGGNAIGKHLKSLFTGIKSPDDLFDLLESFKDLLAPPTAETTAFDVDTSGRPTHIEGNSIFGMLLRRVLLSCKMSFEALSRLFHELRIYSLAKTSVSKINIDNVNSTEKKAKTDDTEVFVSHVSKRQLQNQLHKKALEIESKVGTVSPKDVEKNIEDMLSVSPDLPRAHFLRYLNCLFHREYQGAVDSLHTYFDYCTRPGGPTSSSTSPGNNPQSRNGTGGNTGAGTLGRRRPMMQYAVLNLAALHFHFGHRREAILAIQETVRVSQQNGDHVCVAFALSWLFRLADGGGDESAKQLLGRCLQRAEDLGLHNVQGLTHLVVSQHQLLEIASVPTAMPPAALAFNACTSRTPSRIKVLETIRRGVVGSSRGVGAYVSAAGAGAQYGKQRHLNSINNPAAARTALQNQQAKADAIKSFNASLWTPSLHLNSTMDIMARGLILESTAWDLFGHSSLSTLSSLSHLHLFFPNGAAVNNCLSLCKLAAAQVSRGNLTHLCPPVPKNNQYGGSAYVPALSLLLSAKNTYGSEHNNIIVKAMAFLLHKRAIARADIKESISLGSLLLALSPTRQSVMGIGGNMNGEGFHIDAHAQSLDTLRSLGRLVEAHQQTRELLAYCADESLSARQMNLELFLAQVFQQSGNFNSVCALPHILKCMSKTQKNGHDNHYATAAVKLAFTHFHLGHINRALQLLHRALPQVLSHGSLELQGETHLTLAKCYLAAASTYTYSESLENETNYYCFENYGFSVSGHKRLERIDWVSIAKDALQKAFTCFQQAELVKMVDESLYLIARVYNELATHTLKRINQYRNQHDHRAAGEAVVEYKEYISYRDSAAKRFISSRETRVRPVDVKTGFNAQLGNLFVSVRG